MSVEILWEKFGRLYAKYSDSDLINLAYDISDGKTINCISKRILLAELACRLDVSKVCDESELDEKITERAFAWLNKIMQTDNPLGDNQDG